MSLGDSQLERYARQVIIPGVGADGQERLLASRVLVVGYARERAVATEYLAGSGVNVCMAADDSIDCILACRLDTVSDDELARLGTQDAALVWYNLAGRELAAGSVERFDGSRPARVRSVPPEARSPEETALGSLAACDAAASTIALLLGWQDEHESRRESLLG
jgi:hypothetical protein